jgi:hypothetical protein
MGTVLKGRGIGLGLGKSRIGLESSVEEMRW